MDLPEVDFVETRDAAEHLAAQQLFERDGRPWVNGRLHAKDVLVLLNRIRALESSGGDATLRDAREFLASVVRNENKGTAERMEAAALLLGRA